MWQGAGKWEGAQVIEVAQASPEVRRPRPDAAALGRYSVVKERARVGRRRGNRGPLHIGCSGARFGKIAPNRSGAGASARGVWALGNLGIWFRGAVQGRTGTYVPYAVGESGVGRGCRDGAWRLGGRGCGWGLVVGVRGSAAGKS